MLVKSKLAALSLDKVTDEHAQQFCGEYGKLSPSGINRGLRTLRRALNPCIQMEPTGEARKVRSGKKRESA
jgi:hypothetical protein